MELRCLRRGDPSITDPTNGARTKGGKQKSGDFYFSYSTSKGWLVLCDPAANLHTFAISKTPPDFLWPTGSASLARHNLPQASHYFPGHP